MTIPFHPVIQAWFNKSFGEPTDVQKQAWSSIKRGEHTLIAAPTGSGKTLAALLPCLDRIIQAPGSEKQEERGVKVLYVTPLKALNNDIHHHLFRFAAEMSAVAREEQLDWRDFKIGVRTGDTAQSTRASMLRTPPDVLVTTPESLYLMLTSLKAREILRTVRQVIVDEIHDLAAGRRGVHLSLSLERLSAMCGLSPQRIGVSATQKPLERVAQFLGGWEREERDNPSERSGSGHADRAEQTPVEELSDDMAMPRSVQIVESTMERRLRVEVTMPKKGGIRAKNKEAVWTPLVERLAELMEGSRSVLVFVNNRRLCERLTLRLNDHMGYDMAQSHHGSVSRERRLQVESMLKTGELRCLVATSTLELGIDVGYVDLVIQIDSPKEAAAGIQRVGRAGHAVGGESRGVFVIRSRGDLPEAAVLAQAVALRDIEDIRIPRLSLDVAAQQTVAAVAASARGEPWTPEGLYRLFLQSDCYRGFPYERFTAMLEVLSGVYPFARPLIRWDREEGLLYPLPASSMAASMGAGTIQQSSAFPVHHAESRQHLGELDEEYVYESRVGDTFQLGTHSWSIVSIRHDRVYVKESSNPMSEIPFWRAEAGGRSSLVGQRIGMLLSELGEACRRPGQEGAALRKLEEDHRLDAAAAGELMSYVASQVKHSAVPTHTLIVAEHYKDDGERHHLVVHSLLGKRINRTWELILRARFQTLCPYPVYSTARDDGIEFVFPEWDGGWAEEVARISPAQAERALWEVLPSTSMLGKAFRQIAETSLLLSRGFERQSSWKKRFLSERLLKDALPFAEGFPFLREAYTVCMEEELDMPGFLQLLEGLRTGAVLIRTVDSIAPSPFAVRFIGDYAQTALYESDALGRDVQLRLLNLNRSLATEWFGDHGLSALISEESRAAVRDSLERPEWLGSFLSRSKDVSGQAVGQDQVEIDKENEEAQHELATDREWALLRLLKEFGDLSLEELVQVWHGGTGDRSLAFEGGGSKPAEMLERLATAKQVMAIRLGGEERWICRDEADWYARFPHSKEAAAFIVRRYMDRVLSFTPQELALRYGIEEDTVQSWLENWRQEGLVEPAPQAEAGQTGLYASSKVAERLVRASIRDFRSRNGSVDPERYAAYLMQIHRLMPGRQLNGQEGLLEAISLLQGLYMPLSWWEGCLFPWRVADYRPAMLDQLSASGEIFWLGLKEPQEKEGRIAFFLPQHREAAQPFIRRAAASACSQPELLALLERKGASFLTSLARDTGEQPSALMERLLDLVWEGRVSNDQFAPLRTPQAKGGKAKPGAFRSGFGRWYAVEPSAAVGAGELGIEGAAGAAAIRAIDDDGIQAAALQFCRSWIARFGVLVRGISGSWAPFAWDRIIDVLRQLEDWGMVIRGFYVGGIESMQFSTKEQVEALQALPRSLEGQPVMVPAIDPANPFGSWLDWPELSHIHFARKPGNFLVYRNGRWVLWIENYGKHIVPIPSEESMDSSHTEGAASQAGLLAFVLKQIMVRHHLRKITVERWDGMSTIASPVSEVLQAIGGERDAKGIIFWPSSLAAV